LMDRAECPNRRLLHNILRVRAIAREPARRRQRILEVRDDDPFKFRSSVFASHNWCLMETRVSADLFPMISGKRIPANGNFAGLDRVTSADAE
jgi:hypothetical protein